MISRGMCEIYCFGDMEFWFRDCIRIWPDFRDFSSTVYSI